MEMPGRGKKYRDYMADMRWCRARIEEGHRAFCIRDKVRGLIVTFTTDPDELTEREPVTDESHELKLDEVTFMERPLGEFTITEIKLDPGKGVHFMFERAWEGGGR